MNTLASFAKKANVATDSDKAKTVSCLESCKVEGNKITLVLDASKYSEAQSTKKGAELYMNFTVPKQNVEIDGFTVGLRLGGNIFIGNAK